MANALVVWAEEGCVFEHKNRGESSNRHFNLWFPNGATPPCVSRVTRYRLVPGGHLVN